MYAVIESGGKQYRVELGAEIQVDRLDAHPGDAITLDRVLLVADGDATAVGQPLVAGATVSAEVLRQVRGDKIVVFKYKPKARTRVKQGHRAELTTLRIADIAFDGKSAAKDAQQAESKKGKAQREAEKQAEQQAAVDRELAARLAAAAPATVAESTVEAEEATGPKRPSKTRSTARQTSRAKNAQGETVPPAEDAEPAADTIDADATLPPQDAASDAEPAADATSANDNDTDGTPADGAPADDARKDE